MKEDRFLTGILIGIALLVVASLTLFFLRKDTQTYLPEDNPEAIVHNYIFALEKGDFEQAYSYLAEEKNMPSYTEFQQDLFRENNEKSVQVGTAEINDDRAWVTITLSEKTGFFGDYSYSERAVLIKQGNDWKIFYMSYPYWSWDWYEEN